MTQIWAHRGARAEATENTVAAFAAAIDAGADGVELDVHPTADGILVVHHDPEVVLPDGARWLIASLTAAEVAAVRLDPAGSAIPTLTQVCGLLAPTTLVLNVELKDGAAPYAGVEELVVAAIRGSGMAERVVVSSFNHHTLRRVATLAPEIPIAPLYECALVEPWDYALRLGARAAHPYAPTLTIPGTVAGFARAGVAVRAWTVNDPDHQRALLAAGIDAIITDDPRTAVVLRDSLATS